MPGPTFDDDLFERLLTKRIEPDDAPPEVAHVARLIRRASAPAAAAELADQDRVVAAMAAAVQGASTAVAPSGRRSMFARRFSAKVAGIAAAATLLGATAAAAATGSLPSPAQNTVAGAFSHAGIDLPKPPAGHRPNPVVGSPGKHNDGHGTAGNDDRTTSTSVGSGDDNTQRATDNMNTTGSSMPRGPDANGPAKFGLCTAAHVNSDSTTTSTSLDKNSVAFRNLADAAAQAGMTLEDFCKDATPGRSANSGQGSPNSNGVANGHSGTTKPGDNHGHNKATTTTTGSPTSPTTTDEGHGESNHSGSSSEATTTTVPDNSGHSYGHS